MQLLQQRQAAREGEMVVLQWVMVGDHALLKIVHQQSWHMTPGVGRCR